MNTDQKLTHVLRCLEAIGSGSNEHLVSQMAITATALLYDVKAAQQDAAEKLRESMLRLSEVGNEYAALERKLTDLENDYLDQRVEIQRRDDEINCLKFEVERANDLLDSANSEVQQHLSYITELHRKFGML